MSEVYIIGIGMTKFARHLDRSIKSLSQEAVTAALQDSGVSNEALEAAFAHEGPALVEVLSDPELL